MRFVDRVEAAMQRQDPPRDEPMRRVHFDCVVAHCVLPGMHEDTGQSLATEGPNTFLVYESDLPKLMARVEPTPQLIDAAKKHYVMTQEQYVAQRRAEAKNPSLQWEDVAPDFPGHRTWVETFQVLNLRGPKPLANMTVEKEPLPAPETAEDKRMRSFIAEMMRATRQLADTPQRGNK